MNSIKDLLGTPQPIQEPQREVITADETADGYPHGWCPRCLKGTYPGARPNGFFCNPPNSKVNGIIYEEESVSLCPDHETCKLIEGHHQQLIRNARVTSRMPESLQGKTVNGFRTGEAHQNILFNIGRDYVLEAKKNLREKQPIPWIYIGGQTGCGKTHICSAITNALIADGRKVRYYAFMELTRAVNERDYETLDDAKRYPILFLDDFFKVEPNDWELKELFDLIDFRYRENLPTIISSEKPLDLLSSYDAAIAGRITEKCGRYYANISAGTNKNYRTKGISA